MKNYVGMKWSQLTKQEKENLLSKANCIDGRTGNTPTEDGKCIVDLLNNLSVAGSIKDGEIKINGTAIMYDPAEGVINAQQRYDSNNTVQKKLKLNKKTDEPLIKKLNEVDNIQGYIKQLIRDDIKNEKR